MDKICNFDIVINTCLAEINPTSLMPDFDKNGFLLSVINGFAYTRDGLRERNRRSCSRARPADGLRERNGRSCSQA